LQVHPEMVGEAHGLTLVAYRYAMTVGLGARLDGMVDHIRHMVARKSKQAEELPKV
jgi:hypothetical protein